MADKNYGELVQQAEKAVEPVKDPELKRIAFGKILDSLLGASGVPRRAGSSGSKKTKRGSSSDSGSSEGPKSPKKRSGTQGYIQELVDEEFFIEPKTISAVKAELGNRGHHIPLTSLSGPLQTFCKRKILRRQKVEPTDGGKKAFAYSNW